MLELTPKRAAYILEVCEARDKDFHALSSASVDRLLLWADTRNYRKPKNANGSRARYFHAYLARVAARRSHAERVTL